ncbi:MAG: T9SS type A sorting domain-containing protein, partial [Bacteroidales bacterium]
KAYTDNPNNYSDTPNYNDTLIKNGLFVKAAPGILLDDTSKAICQGDSVLLSGTLSGVPPWSLVIQDGSINIPVAQITSPSFSYYLTPASTKTYTVTQISDASGCDNNAEYHFHVGVQPAPPAQITPVTSTAACFGDSVVLMASIGLNFSYQWNLNGTPMPNQTSYTLSCKQAGSYSVKVTSPIGCSSLSAPVNVIIHPLPVVNLGNDTAILPGQHIMLNAGAGFTSYLWSTGATTQSVMIDTSGTGPGVKTVWVNVTDNYGCHGTDTIKINFTQNPGISNTKASSGKIFLYPNPTDGKLELVLHGFASGTVELELYGQHGRRVLQEEHLISSPETSLGLNLSTLADGIYLLKTTTTEGISTRKLVLRR